MRYLVNLDGTEALRGAIPKPWWAVFNGMWFEAIVKQNALSSAAADGEVILSNNEAWRIFVLLPSFASLNAIVRAIDWIDDGGIAIFDPPAMLVTSGPQETIWVGGVSHLWRISRHEVIDVTARYIARHRGAWRQSLRFV